MNVEEFIDLEALEIIKLSNFDDELKLSLSAKHQDSEQYTEYWKNLVRRLKKNSAVETED